MCMHEHICIYVCICNGLRSSGDRLDIVVVVSVCVCIGPTHVRLFCFGQKFVQRIV